MTKISTYVVDEKVTALDKWIGSDANMQNRTKNFTPKKLAAYFNEDQVINIGTPLQYKYYTLDPLEARPNGTLTFETEIGPTVNFSSITTFLLSKYTTKQNIVSDFLNFLDGSKVLLFKSSDINSFGFYRIASLEPYEPDPNFFVVTVAYETGNGALEEDEDYMISLVSLAGDFIPTKTSELINDGDDGVNPFISELDIDRTEWDSAYEGKINSAEVTGTTTKTLTLTKQDGGTIEASWADSDTGLTSVGVSMPSAFSVANSPLTSNGTITITGAGTSLEYVKGDGTLGTFPTLTGYVPYTGANQSVDLGTNLLSSGRIHIEGTAANTGSYLGFRQYLSVTTSSEGYTSLYAFGSQSLQFLFNQGGTDNKKFTFNVGSITANVPGGRVYSMPDADGTLALTSNLSSYVPYTGATADVNLGIYQLKADSLAVSTTSTETIDAGEIVWNAVDGTFDMGLIGGITLQAGQELHMYGKATEVISNGQAVMFAGVQGDHILIAKADAATVNANPEYFIGIATQDFANNQFGYVTVFGNVRGLNTTAYTLGSVLYYDSTTTTDGLLTATEPTAPNAKIIVAAVVRVHANQGILLVRPHVMPKLKDIQDVYAPSPSNNNGLFWNSSTLRYENNSISGILGYTPANDSAVVKLTGVQTIAGIKTFSESTKFDYGVYLKQDGVTASFPGYTTIDGITNGYVVTNGDARTAFFNLANVTSLVYTYPSTAGTFALTSDLHSPVTIGTANGLSLSGQQLSLGLASSSTNGALSSTDWNSFNSKQSAGSYITSLTGEATAAGPGAASVTLNNASVTAKILSGVNITGGSIVDTDTMLTAFGKLQNQINSLIGGSIYQGVWNASTNTPTLTSSVGTDGYYYIVNVAGSTNLNGITDWNIGDWAIFHGGTWQKVDNTDAVSSVNGFTGAVSLTTSNISEGPTNFYYTDARSRSALSFSAGSGAYNNTTGVITIPTNTSQLTNGANYITLASLSGTAPIGYNNTTGSISITQSSDSSDGYLSSTDWTTFNNKLSSLSGAVLTTTNQNVGGIKTFTDLTDFSASGIRIGLQGWVTPNQIYSEGTGNFYVNLSGAGHTIIGNSGKNVGIGTTNPANKLQIGSVGSTGYGGNDLSIGNGTNVYAIYLDNNNTNIYSVKPYTFLVSNVLIGTTTDAGYKLDVSGTGRFSGVLRVDATPPPTTGGSINIRDNNASGTNTSFAGVFFNSGPGSDYSIGKLSENTNGYFQIRNGNNGDEFLRINNIGQSRFTAFDTSGNRTNTFDVLNITAENSNAPYSGFGGALVFKNRAYTSGIVDSSRIASIINNNSVDSYGGSLAFDVTATVGGSYTRAMIINYNGNVGIGTDSPSTQLQVVGSSFSLIRVSAAADNVAGIDFGTVASPDISRIRYNNSTNSMSIRVNSIDALNITSGGNVGIGIMSPVTKFDVVDSSNTFAAKIQGSGGSNFVAIGTTGGVTNGVPSINAYTANFAATTNLSLQPNGGNVGIGTTSPSYKLSIQGSAGIEQSEEYFYFNSTYSIGNNARGKIRAVGAGGGSGYGGDLRFSSRASNNVWNEDVLTIANTGNVGIGTTSPARPLTIRSAHATASSTTYTGALLIHDEPSGVSPHLGMGVAYNSGNQHSWIQSNNTDGSYPLCLNPAGGNVGIGTTSPAAKLHINNGTNRNLWFRENYGSGTELLSINDSQTTRQPLAFSASSYYFDTGNVGIGITSPSNKLSVFNTLGLPSSSALSEAIILVQDSGSNRRLGFGSSTSGQWIQSAYPGVEGIASNLLLNPSGGYVLVGTTSSFDSGLFCSDGGTSYVPFAAKVGTTSNSAQIYFRNPNGIIGSVTTNGSSTSYNTSSDYRLKQDFKSFNGLDLVSKIKVYNYEWKADNSRMNGVIAHELQEVIPYAVTGEKDAEQMQGVDYSKIVPILIQAIQELKQEIEILKNK